MLPRCPIPFVKGQVILSTYQIDENPALSGYNSQIFNATDMTTGRKVVCKYINPLIPLSAIMGEVEANAPLAGCPNARSIRPTS
jgi:hypothetical protein